VPRSRADSPRKPDPEPLQEYFAANVRRLREERGLSQEQFAALALNGDIRRLQRVESGEYDVLLSTLAKFAKDLGVSSADLLKPGTVVRRPRGRPSQK